MTWEFGRKVPMCVAGLGPRGTGQMKVLLEMDDVDIVGVCDVIEERALKAADIVAQKRGVRPAVFTDTHAMLEAVEAEAMLITTDWCSHIRIAIDAMKHGVRPAMEVGGATDVFECWELVRTSEQTGVPCMLLENCCYGKKEMTLLNMVKKELFGDVVYCAGGYEHDLRDEIGQGDETHHYRQRNFMNRNGELYPTHELGPIAQYLNINRGNRMVTLTAMASRAAGQQAWMRANRTESRWYDQKFEEGDVVTTLIKCAHGEMISLTHNCTLPRPYSRGGMIQGTKGIWEEDNESIYIDGVSPVDPEYWTHKWEKDEKYISEYMHPLWKAYEEFGPRGGHDGMDYLALRAFVESVQKGCQPPIDVYDAAAWMCITCLSEQSIAMGSAPVPIPDFTGGRWMERRPSPKSCFALDAVHEDLF